MTDHVFNHEDLLVTASVMNQKRVPDKVWSDRAEWPMALEIRATPSGATGMMAEEIRCFCRVVRGMQNVPSGATFTDALQVQRWMDQLESCVNEA